MICDCLMCYCFCFLYCYLTLRICASFESTQLLYHLKQYDQGCHLQLKCYFQYQTTTILAQNPLKVTILEINQKKKATFFPYWLLFLYKTDSSSISNLPTFLFSFVFSFSFFLSFKLDISVLHFSIIFCSFLLF